MTEQPIENKPTLDASEYETALMTAFVQKPDKVDYYLQAYQKMNLTGSGIPHFKWVWSWWGFGGGFAFLLYRKAYLPALITFILGLISTPIPFGGLLMMVAMGGISPYFVIKRYASLKQEIEATHATSEERIAAMRAVGGYHSWVLWVAVAFYALVLWGLVLIFGHMPY